ncbi:MFS transporter [Streptomyces sp. A7024]|uniref:Putative proline/betaine transporter n=1 Tax=Streptomyces coryli TaxID=1128680 RepID=A0A6G4UC04_9ACTN|nr:MFS transporter [Streptomyces coryli]NGN69749.1 MFS transporter [Streptomyces coryli]
MAPTAELERAPEPVLPAPPQRRAVTVTDEGAVKRAVRATALGNAMEWFDFGVYAYLAVTIGKVFFPAASGTAQVLASLAAFAAAFLVRPLGGMVFGPLGDRIGRKKILALTMIMMSAATFAIGLLPSYAAIGLAAPALLVLCRMVQGFSTGGEYGGAATFIAEYAPDKRRGFWGSFLELGTLVGYTAAAALVTGLEMGLSDDAMLSWGWRIPFLIAGPIGLVGLYLRMRLEETPAYQELAACEEHQARPKLSIRQVLAGQWRAMALCMALVAAFNVTDYVLLSYMPTYLSDTLGFAPTTGLMSIVLVMIVLMLLINRVGALSDRFGRRAVLMGGSLAFLVTSVPALLLIKVGSWPAVFAGLLVLGLALLGYVSTMSSTLPALFPTDRRYASLSISFNVSVSLFGGTTPLVVAALVSSTGNDLMPAFYMMLFAGIGLIAAHRMEETAGRPLKGSPPSVSTEAEAEALRNAPRIPTAR